MIALMASPTSKLPRMTLEEYLRFEETAPERHEYLDGQVLAMAGGSFEHQRINRNLTASLANILRGKPCQSYMNDLKVWIHSHRTYLYPDQSILCAPPEAPPEAPRYAASNPTVVFEILSPSSEAFDRREKFQLYFSLVSLREYVLISQDQPRVEIFRRHDGGSWLFSFAEGLDAAVELRSVGITLPLRELYDGVAFPPS
jgi:Uma2 family endonuclease